MNRILIAIAALSFASQVRAEEEASTVDVTALEGKVASLEEQYAETKATVAALSRIKWSGYVQGRYTYQECVGNTDASKGCTYNKLAGGPPDKDNLFIRRGRIKVVYDADLAQFVLQLDVTPQDGVSPKEAYASVKLPKGFAIDAGLQLLPFGYDVGVRSSSDLDLLERYLGAGYWLNGEYDVGVALRGAYGPVNLRVGLFNGDGVKGAKAGLDNDQIKDVIGRLGFDFGMITGGVSGWYGHTRDYKAFPNKTYDRNRIGADLQVFLDLLPIGGTALKGEIIAGKTGLGTSTSAPNNAGADPGRAGHAWQGTLTQNLGSQLQLAGRYQQFVKNNNLDAPASGGSVKEVNELDLAVHYYVGGNYKLSLAYWHPMNGKVLGSTADPTKIAGDAKKTDQWVVQAQAKF